MKRSKKLAAGLQARIKDFEASGINHRGRHRPGSMNAKKARSGKRR